VLQKRLSKGGALVGQPDQSLCVVAIEIFINAILSCYTPAYLCELWIEVTLQARKLKLGQETFQHNTAVFSKHRYDLLNVLSGADLFWEGHVSETYTARRTLGTISGTRPVDKISTVMRSGYFSLAPGAISYFQETEFYPGVS
jgi:hypothetical protein